MSKTPFIHKPNSGSIFPNDRREKDTDRDHNGTLNIEGVEYWISGWNNSGTRGPYISLSVKRKDAAVKQAVKEAHKAADGKPYDDTDDPPF